MSKETRTSIVLYGNIVKDNDLWWRWYLKAKDVISEFNYVANYIDARSETFKTGKVLLIKKAESRLKKALDSGEDFNSLGVMSLRENFKQAVFDYNIFLGRSKYDDKTQAILLSVSREQYSEKHFERLIDELKPFVGFTSGQIFELSGSEHPDFYASKVNRVSFYKTLKILKEF